MDLFKIIQAGMPYLILVTLIALYVIGAKRKRHLLQEAAYVNFTELLRKMSGTNNLPDLLEKYRMARALVIYHRCDQMELIKVLYKRLAFFLHDLYPQVILNTWLSFSAVGPEGRRAFAKEFSHSMYFALTVLLEDQGERYDPMMIMDYKLSGLTSLLKNAADADEPVYFDRIPPKELLDLYWSTRLQVYTDCILMASTEEAVIELKEEFCKAGFRTPGKHNEVIRVRATSHLKTLADASNSNRRKQLKVLVQGE